MVQETFKSIWKTKYNESFDGHEFNLLTKILRRRIIDARRLRRFPETNCEYVDVPVEDVHVESGYSDHVQEALNQINSQMRETFLLVVVGEFTCVKVAEIQNIPFGTVQSRVDRARKHLRKLLKEEKCLA